MVTITDGSTAVSTSEIDLFTPVVGDNTYGCKIYLNPMDVGDQYVFRLYDYDGTSASYKGYIVIPKFGKQPTDELVLFFAPIFAHRYKLTAQKVSGTDRTFNWSRGVY